MDVNQQIAPTRAEFRSLRECKTLGEAFSCAEFLDRIKQSAPAHVKPSRMLRTFIQATSRTPLLLQCNMRSVLGAMLTCSEVGLEPNTPLQHAFLIPFGKYKWNPQNRTRELQGYDVQLIFGYPGLLDLAYRSGHVTSVHADVVWRADEFSFSYGTESHLRHVPSGRHEGNEVPLWGYAHANLTHGQAFEVMPWADILRIRNQSQGYQAALRAKEAGEKAPKPYIPAAWTDAPWTKHEVAMARKTVFRSLWKWLPHSVELAGALALDEQQDRGTVDFSGVIDGNASILEGGFQDGEAIEGETTDATAVFGTRAVENASADAPNGAWASTDKAHEANKPAPARQQAAPVASDTERDSAGVAWNERLHASSKARNTDGTWRARRGADKEAAPEQHQDEPAGGGLFGDETQQQNSPAQPGPQSGTASGAAVSDEPRSGGGAEASAGHLAPFEAWLVDGEGNPIADADGVIEAIRDPVAFARAYMEALSNEFPGTIDLFKAANKEALVAAMIASTEVALILAGTVKDAGGAGGAGPAIDPAFVPPPSKNTKAEFESYLARLKVVAGTWTTDAAITHGVDVNAPTYEATNFPAPYRMKAKGIIADRREAMKPAPARGAPEPTLNDVAERMASDLASFTNGGEIVTWRAYAPIAAELDKLSHGAPDLYDRVTRFAERRRLELLAAQMTAKVRATTTLAACDGITTDKWCIATYLDLQKNADDLAQQVKMDSRAHRATLEEGQTATG